MLRFLLFLFFSLICCARISVHAQVADRTPVVVYAIEEGTESPIAGITLKVDGKVRGITDKRGYVSFDRALLPATVTLSGVGFETIKQHWGSSVALSKISIPKRLNSLKETVVTGVPRPTRLKNALSQYRIINMEDSKAQGNVTLADALATELNIGVASDPILGSKVKMQGLDGNKIKVLVDGLPVNGRENGNIDMGQLNLNNIARIELIQGPMSVVYGSDALGGVINLITKKATKPLSFNGGFNYESVGKYNADAAITRNWKHHQLSVGGGRNFFKGWGDADTINDGYTPHRKLIFKPKEQYLANGAYTYTTDSGFKLQLASDFVREKVTDRGSAKVDALEGYGLDGYYRNTRFNNRLMLEGKLGKKGHWESKNNYAYYRRTRESVRRDLVTLDEIPTAGVGDQDTSTFHDINLRSNYSSTFGKLKYDAGYDFNLEYAYSGKIPGGTRNVDDYGLYQNFAHTFFKDNLTLQAGLRETYNTQYNAPFIYSFQTLYTPIEHVQLRASYAKGFRAPTLKEQYLEFIDQNHHILGNPNLKAERGDEVQLSASWQAYEHANDYVQFIVTGFYNNVYDQIALAAMFPDIPNDDHYTYVNISRVQNIIGNIQIEQQWSNFHLVLGYGLTHYWKEAGYDAYDVSEVVARAQYYWRGPGLSFSAFYKLTGESPSVVEGVDGTVSVKGSLPTYSMLDASISRKFWKKRVEIIAGVKNVLDVRQVVPTGSIAGAGGAHASDDGSTSFLPRRVFTTVRLNLF